MNCKVCEYLNKAILKNQGIEHYILDINFNVNVENVRVRAPTHTHTLHVIQIHKMPGQEIGNTG